MRVIPAEEFSVTRSSTLSVAEVERCERVMVEYVSTAVRNQAPYFIDVGGVEIIAVRDVSASRPPRSPDGVEYRIEARATAGSFGDIGGEITGAGVLGDEAGFNPSFPIVFSLEYWDSDPTQGAIVTSVTGYVGERGYALTSFEDLQAFNAACTAAHGSVSVSATGRILRVGDPVGR